MSFRLYIYYCALSGGWAAFLVWVLVQAFEVLRMTSLPLRATLIGGLLGAAVTAAIGLVDSVAQSTGWRWGKRVAVSSGLGLVGGAVGGLVGQMLQSKVGVPLVVGWMLAGVLIGASLGVFDILEARLSGQTGRGAMRKMIHGIQGGLLGGFLGGLPFTFLSSSTLLPRAGLTLSLVLLGGSIGLMVGLAQVVLKDAWLKIEEGEGAGREVLLSKEQTTIGRAESCDLGLFGDNAVQRLHARVLRQGSRYLLCSLAEQGETLVNQMPVGNEPVGLRAGDTIQIGRTVLRFGERPKGN